MTWLTDPIDWWVTPFADNPFIRDALWAALLTVVCTSVIGTWVVLRGLSFLGDALAHGVLPGIAIAFVLGVLHHDRGPRRRARDGRRGPARPQRLTAPRRRVDRGAVRRVPRPRGRRDVVAGRRRQRRPHPVPVRLDQRRRRCRLCANCRSWPRSRWSVWSSLHRALLVGTFDAAQARLLGFRPQLTHFVLLVLLALSIVASFETVGSLLVFAFLIAPPATASLVFRRVPSIMVARGCDRRRRCGGRPAGQLPPRDRDRRHHGADDRGRSSSSAWWAATSTGRVRRAGPGSPLPWIRYMADPRLAGTQIADSVIDVFGNTPLVRLHRISEVERIPSVLAMKMETTNPGGSAKDRPALEMILAAERDGLLATGRHDRRADERQHRRGTGDRRRPAGVHAACS